MEQTAPSTLAPAPACQPESLTARLQRCAELWARVNDASLSRLASAVLNDTGYFARLASPEPSTTTRTLERFARYLTDPANWAGELVPDEVCLFAHAVGISGEGCRPSPDIAGQIIDHVPALRQAQDERVFVSDPEGAAESSPSGSMAPGVDAGPTLRDPGTGGPLATARPMNAQDDRAVAGNVSGAAA
jgi:hypothetical protein